MENINDEYIKKFVNLLVRIYKYDYNKVKIGLGKFENADDFYNYVNNKISIIEDNDILNTQLNETSTQLNKISKKYYECEKTLLNTYNQNEENKITISNLKIENNKLKETTEELYNVKNEYDKKITILNNQYNKLKKKYEENKIIVGKLSDKLVNTKDIMEKILKKNNEFESSNNLLVNENNKLIKEIEEIDNIKKTLINKLSSTEMITDLDTSISNLINKSNEYQLKYNELNIKNSILQDNYNELNDKYNELFLNQTKETNELKSIIKQLTEQIEQDRIKYNENMIVKEIKNNLEGGNHATQGIKYIDIRDKKAIEFFDKDIKLLNEMEQKNNTLNMLNKTIHPPISQSTDYMVDLLKASDKMINSSKQFKSNTINKLDTLQEIEISEDIEEEPTNNIFMKIKNEDMIIDEGEKYIDVRKLQILKSEENGTPNKNFLALGETKQEIDEFIKKNQDILLYQKGGNKGKIEIREIGGKKKINFNDDYSTLTEQNIDLKNDDAIKKMKHRKYMRRNREQKRIEQLKNDL